VIIGSLFWLEQSPDRYHAYYDVNRRGSQRCTQGSKAPSGPTGGLVATTTPGFNAGLRDAPYYSYLGLGLIRAKSGYHGWGCSLTSVLPPLGPAGRVSDLASVMHTRAAAICRPELAANPPWICCQPLGELEGGSDPTTSRRRSSNTVRDTRSLSPSNAPTQASQVKLISVIGWASILMTTHGLDLGPFRSGQRSAGWAA
jgi:hypothetical protein